MEAFIYKVVKTHEWQDAKDAGTFSGVGIDLTDGFIHLSGPDQVVGTVKKYFAGQVGLVLLKVEAARLGETLRWETSRDGMLFPHVYGDVPLAAIVEVKELPVLEDGMHQFPDDLNR